MTPRILLTTLGTTDYSLATYQWREYQPVQTKLVSAALKTWLPPGAEVKVLLTPKAEQKNGALLRELIPENIPIPISNGDNDDDNWRLFEAVADAVPSGAEVFFDVTHGFRSLPVVTLLALSYLRIVKNIKLEAVVYGAWEPGRPADVVTPVFDLTLFVSLLDWAQAANRFQDTGDASLFHPLLREDRNAALNGVADKLKELSGALANNRTIEASRLARELVKKIESSRQQETILKHRPFLTVIDQMSRAVTPLQQNTDERLNLLSHHAQILWYYERGHYVQAIGLAREWLVSVMTWHQTGELQVSGPVRSETENFLGVYAKSPDAAERALQPITALWDKITNLRNDLLHFGMRPDSNRTRSAKVEQRVKETIEALPAAVRPLGLELEPPLETDS